ncbi:Ribokinase-like protein [Pterulicium gracile]|uniref:ATP-dependent (S)-NAD(P)H-hydrate dehydratase n=1 Tax=Pterulicium gracile TaxID=1884261 RepID=A0A5C3QUY6_9AGAR|nr:Ribokinase-like protein [Pterula gracilis]
MSKVPKAIFDQIRQIIPPLNGTLHKGQSGRVAVLGGAQDYSGAPFFAAISAQRVGADLSHVICSPTAAPSIKSYSPDLIVHPILSPSSSPSSQSTSTRAELKSILTRMHVLIIGPGLGREPYMLTHALTALTLAKSQNLFIVLDADGLGLVNDDPDVIRGYERCVLTPNVVEFGRLCETLGVPSSPPSSNGDGGGGVVEEGWKAREISKRLGGVTVLEKGGQDVIAWDTTESSSSSDAKSKEVVLVDKPGGLKRCGGQGDILSGAVGTMLAWGKCYEDGAFGPKTNDQNRIPTSRLPLLAAVAASLITRTTSHRGFAKHGRAMVTQDLIGEIGAAFEEVFGAGEGGSGRDVQGKL